MKRQIGRDMMILGSIIVFALISGCKKDVPISAISLSQANLLLEKGTTQTLVATILPEDATDKTVNWSSSDASVASVDQAGRVTALKNGKATITAHAGGASAHCDVEVTTSASSISLDKTTLVMEKGMSETLVATVLPDDATDKTVSWSSSDASVASVDQAGRVTALKNGKATITAHAGGASAHCDVEVTTSASSISLDKTTLVMEKGMSETLVATVLPDDATDKTVSWSSSDASVASVDQAGRVTALKNGKATITAHAGGVSAYCDIEVITKVSCISLDKTTLVMEKGTTEALVATVLPEDATDKTVNWKSSDASVASVDQEGRVTANAVGEAEIKVSTPDGKTTAICHLTVITPGGIDIIPEINL